MQQYKEHIARIASHQDILQRYDIEQHSIIQYHFSLAQQRKRSVKYVEVVASHSYMHAHIFVADWDKDILKDTVCWKVRCTFLYKD